ncbi:hypothetical protein HGA89_03050, partial [bacterium]|nr:hypothetical protein [bacterium]
TTVPAAPGWVAANLAAIAFVQGQSTLEIHQAGAAFAGTRGPSPITGRNHP